LREDAGHAAPDLVGHADGGTELPGGTVSALKTIMLDEGGLKRVQPIFTAEPFDRRDRAILVLYGERQAGIDPFAVDEDRAGSAGALVAAFLGSCQVKMISKQIQQRCTVVDRQLMRSPIHDEMHPLLPSQIHATSTHGNQSGCASHNAMIFFANRSGYATADPGDRHDGQGEHSY
jgi:hypothetical protein